MRHIGYNNSTPKIVFFNESRANMGNYPACVHFYEENTRRIINSRGQPTRGGLPAWGLGEMLTTPSCEKQNVKNYS